MNSSEKFREKITKVIYAAVAKTMNVDVNTLTDETQPIADLGAKSVNFVHIVSAIEDESGLEVPFMQLRRQKTIAEMINFAVELYEN
ncbi:MAG TPA: acyl carrier protein [Oscillospiraceae bacterium]|nr:acyl carrier protein [Oscillospiraceae bacterium]